MKNTYVGKSHDGQPLGDRCKTYEVAFETLVPPGEYLIIRLDGHKFSKYTKEFKRPYDETFRGYMEETTIRLCKEFGAYTGYTQSDEITLIVPPSVHSTAIYNGRTQKIASLTASLCSTHFNMVSDGTAWFDARVYGVPTLAEATNQILWRCRDAEKNSKNMFAQTYCTHKDLLNKTSNQQVEYCKTTTGNDWEAIEDRFKFGSLIKKVHVDRYSEHLEGFIKRGELQVFARDMTTFSDELCELVDCKILKDL